jgi:hypothetical protein
MKTIILDTVNKSVVLNLAEAHTTSGVILTTHYADSLGGSFTEGSNQVSSNGVSEVTLVAVPSGSNKRIVRNITAYNSDTVTHSLLIRMKDTSTTYSLVTVNLISGATWSSGDILVLDATDEVIRAYLGEAITTTQVNYTLHYADVNSSGLIEGNNVSVSNGVTAVDILSAPAASTRRVIKDLTVYNRDSVTHVVYLMLRKASTDYIFKKITLLTGENWSLSQGNTYEIDHTNLKNVGNNTHAQLDTFVSSKASASGLASLNGSTLVVENPANATATPTASKIVIADGSGKVDGWVTTATTSASGISELATSGEVTTGTDTGRTIPVASLAKSNIYGVKAGCFRVVAETVDVDTTSGVFYFWIPQALDGLSLLRANAMVDTAGTTNATTIQVRNLTKYGGFDALQSTGISIASGATIGTAGTIATSYDDVSTNDKIKVYVTGQSTTKPKGLSVVLEYQLY